VSRGVPRLTKKEKERLDWYDRINAALEKHGAIVRSFDPGISFDLPYRDGSGRMYYGTLDRAERELVIQLLIELGDLPPDFPKNPPPRV